MLHKFLVFISWSESIIWGTTIVTVVTHIIDSDQEIKTRNLCNIELPEISHSVLNLIGAHTVILKFEYGVFLKSVQEKH